MASALHKGDRVRWRAGGGTAIGTVERVLTRRATIRGRSVAATAKSPRYVVKNEKTGTTSVKTAAALRPARANAATARSARPTKASQPPPTRPERSIPRWPIFAGGAIGLVALLALAYVLFLLPGKADDYAEKAGPAQEEVATAIQSAFDSFERHAFYGTGIEVNPDKRLERIHGPRRQRRESFRLRHADYDAASASIDEARRVINANEAALTDVGAPPLLGGVGALADAQEVAEHADAYIAGARAFLDEYERVVTYFEQQLAADEVEEAKFLNEDPATISRDPLSPRQVRRLLEKTLEEERRAAERYRALEPAEALERVDAALEELSDLDVRDAQGMLKVFIDPGGQSVFYRIDLYQAQDQARAELKAAYAELHEDSDLTRSMEAIIAEGEELTTEIDAL